jgi:hypothetical protein
MLSLADTIESDNSFSSGLQGLGVKKLNYFHNCEKWSLMNLLL